jgi:hypothetical protein
MKTAIAPHLKLSIVVQIFKRIKAVIFLSFSSFGSLSMPRIQRIYCSPATIKLICPVEGCRKECRSYGGLTQHLHAKHKDYQPGTPPSAAAVNDCLILDSDLPTVTDLEIPDSDPAGVWDAFGSESNRSVSFDFENPLFLSSPPDSPSRESEASGLNVDYHPIINGQ